MKRIIIVSSSVALRRIVYAGVMSVIPNTDGIYTFPACSFDSAVVELATARNSYDLAIIDLMLDGQPRGIELASILQTDAPDTAIIIVSHDIKQAQELAEDAEVKVDAFIMRSENLAQIYHDLDDAILRPFRKKVAHP